MKQAIACFHIVRRYYRALSIQYILKQVGLGAFLLVFAITAVYTYTRVYPGAYETKVYAQQAAKLNFQARLLDASGAIASDGTYSVEFNLYDQETAGSTLWTETQTVEIKSGYLSVHLGDSTALPGSIDWSEQHWLTMNVEADGEMTPRIRLTAVPLAFRSLQADSLTDGTSSLTVDELVQLAPSSPQAISSLDALIRVNQTDSGGLLQLQQGGSDVFTVENDGSISGAGSADFAGALQTNGITRLTSTGALENVTASTDILTSGLLPVSRGGTGNGTFTANGVIFGDGTNSLKATAAGTGGQVLLADTNGTPAFTSFSGDATIAADGAVSVNSVQTDSVTLGTDTVGDYVESLGALTGLTTSGNNGEGSTPALSVLYGTTADTAVEGSTTLVCPGSTGNLSGGGNTITLGAGGTCDSLSIIDNPTFTTSVTSPLFTNAGPLTLSTTGAGNDLTLSSASGLVALSATTVETTSGLSFNLSSASDNTFTIENTGAGVAHLNIASGGLQTAGTLRLTNGGALQNVTGNNNDGVSFDANTITSGLLPVTRGGTGAGSFTTNGILYGNNTGALNVTTAGTGGQVMLANSSGVPTFTSLSGDVTVNSSGDMTIGANAVALGTDTTGEYVADITIEGGGGLVVSGTGVETATASLTIRRDCSNNQIVKWSTSGSGAWNCANDSTGISDSRVKTNVATIDANIFDKLKSVRLVSFDYDCGSPAFDNLHCNTDHQAGVIAQELAEIFPELVYEDNNGYFNVRYDILGVYNMRALGQLSSVISANGDADLRNVSTGGVQRLTSNGVLQNINGLQIVSGGASIVGGINNNSGGLSNTGPVSGATTIQASGRITGLSGMSISGEMINLNANSNKSTNINTGSSTGIITIGGGNAPLVINSSAFKVSSAGALSGITSIQTSGNINTQGVFQVNGASGVSGSCTGNNSYLQDWTISGGIVTDGECRSGGVLSDARLKENIVSLDDSILDGVGMINTVNFDFKCKDEDYASLNLDCERQTGVIAQELAEIFPELVYKGDDGYYRVHYDALNIYTLKAVSEVAQRIDSQGNINAGTVKTNDAVRLTEGGKLTNINGLSLVAGGASVTGGINNNMGGLDNVGSIQGATSIRAQNLELTSEEGATPLRIVQEDEDVFTIADNGALEIFTSDTHALGVRNQDGESIFQVDSENGLVYIGDMSGSAETTLLVLAGRDDKSDPEGVPGAQYYNNATNRFRCYQEDNWQDCIPTTTTEYMVLTSAALWQQADVETPVESASQVWADMSTAHEVQVQAEITEFSDDSEVQCHLQYSFESMPEEWSDLGDSLTIKAAGTLRTGWQEIPANAQAEVLVRLVCMGDQAEAVDVGMKTVRLQVR